MNKNVFCAALLAWAALPVCAQTLPNEVVEENTDKYKVETNRFWNNWFISAGGGAQVFWGDHDHQASFGDRLAPAFDVAVGKWFTPGIGLRVMYSGHQIKGATQKWNPTHSTGQDVPGKGGQGYWLEKQKFDMFNLHADVLLNLHNLFGGYKKGRVWNCSPYAGLGWARVWKTPKAKELSANVGLLNSFRLCSALDLNLDVRGMFVNDRFDGEEGGRQNEGLLTATVGLTYKFKERGWGRSKTIIRYNNEELDAMREKLRRLTDYNRRLQEALKNKNKDEARVIVKRIASANLVTFPINKAKLSNEARASLGMLAEVIKSGDKQTVYTVTGYADAATGTKAVNERLSKKRAQAVFDCLTKEHGVNPAQLRIDWKGGVENMFYNDPRVSRAVITRSE